MGDMVYLTDGVKILMEEVLEYMGEIEHGDDITKYEKETIAMDFAIYMKAKHLDTAVRCLKCKQMFTKEQWIDGNRCDCGEGYELVG